MRRYGDVVGVEGGSGRGGYWPQGGTYLRVRGEDARNSSVAASPTASRRRLAGGGRVRGVDVRKSLSHCLPAATDRGAGRGRGGQGGRREGRIRSARDAVRERQRRESARERGESSLPPRSEGRDGERAGYAAWIESHWIELYLHAISMIWIRKCNLDA